MKRGVTMEFRKLSSRAKTILDEIVDADNPSAVLCQKFEGISSKEDSELRGIIKELREGGFINVTWADNIPYFVTINYSARIYNEQLAEHEKEHTQQKAVTIIDNSINIGDGNTISKSNIANKTSKPDTSSKKSFYEKHPIICGILISVASGIILLFSFWSKIISFVEGLF